MTKKNILFIAIFLVLTACSSGNDISEPLELEYEALFSEDLINYQQALEAEGWQPIDPFSNMAGNLPQEKGYIWLRTSFDYDYRVFAGSTGLYLGRIRFSDKSWLNGKLLGQTPAVKKQWNTWNWNRTYRIYSDWLNSKSNKLYIRLYGEGEISLFEKPRIGPLESVLTYQAKSSLFYSDIHVFYSIAFFLISFYHFIIFIYHKKEKFNLYYSVFSFFYAVYNTNQFTEVFYSLLPMEYISFQKVIFSSLYVILYFLYLFLKDFLKPAIKERLHNSVKVYFSLGVIIVLIPTDYLWFYKWRQLILGALVPLMVLNIYTFFKGNHTNQQTARPLIYGFLAAIFFSLIDLVQNMVYMGLPQVSGIGLTIFFGSIMFIMARRSAVVHNDLEKSKNNLEQLVTDRTAQLEKHISEIIRLKKSQDADYYLTSLLMKPFAQNRVKSRSIAIDFLLEQKKKFNFQSWQTEIGGDINIADHITLSDHRYIVFLNADAMGKSLQGASGALVLGAVFEAVLERTRLSETARKSSPERWLKNAYIDLQKVFESFEGSMYATLIMGLIDEHNGTIYSINAEHPPMIRYMNENISLVEHSNILPKLGSIIDTETITIDVDILNRAEVLICGSDGRHDLITGYDSHNEPVIQHNDKVFIEAAKQARGSLKQIKDELQKHGELSDDLSLLRIELLLSRPYKENAYEALKERADLPATIQNDQQLQQLKNYARRYPNDYDNSNKLVEYMSNQSSLREAYEEAQAFIVEEPLNTRMLLLAAKLAAKLGIHEKSIDLGERLRLRNPSDIDAVLVLIESYMASGNLNRADFLIEEAMKLKPDNKELIKLRDDINDRYDNLYV